MPLKDLSNFEHVTPISLNRTFHNIGMAIENEDSLLAIVALAGVIGNLANRFRTPQEVLDYAGKVSFETMRDLSPLANCKTGATN